MQYRSQERKPEIQSLDPRRLAASLRHNGMGYVRPLHYYSKIFVFLPYMYLPIQVLQNEGGFHI